MKITENTFVSLDYVLEVDGKIADQSQPGAPLKFAYGMGMLLPKFEAAVKDLEPGAEFKFTLSPVDGYGETIAEAVVELPKNIFEVNGAIEEDLLVVGNMIPMSDASGNRLVGVVKSVADDKVTMDFNHPMAGKTLNFRGKIVDVRELKPEDLQAFAGSGGCDCGGDDCGCEPHGQTKDGCSCDGGDRDVNKKGDCKDKEHKKSGSCSCGC